MLFQKAPNKAPVGKRRWPMSRQKSRNSQLLPFCEGLSISTKYLLLLEVSRGQVGEDNKNMTGHRIPPVGKPGASRSLVKTNCPLRFFFRQHSQRGRFRIVSVLCLLLMPTLSSAQSTVVSIDRDAEIPLNGQSLTVDRVPSDLSPTIKAVERRLANATPETWRSEMPMEELMFFMSRAGYRVYLSESAHDSNLDESGIIRLALHNASMDENLRFALNAFQCDYTILDSGTIMIASVDEMIENPVNVTFDITNLPQDPYLVAETIEETIDPDGWEANGGTGRIRAVVSNDRRLIVVSSTYQNTRQIRRQLGTFSAMAGATGLPATQDLLAGASTPVQMPDAYDDTGYDRGFRNGRGRGGGFGGGGQGGGGLGGGVF